MLRNLLRDIYSNKKNNKNNLEALLVPLDTQNTLQSSCSSLNFDLPTFGMDLIISQFLFSNTNENNHQCFFSALNISKSVQFSEFSKNNIVSIFLQNSSASKSKNTQFYPSIQQLRESIDLNSPLSMIQKQILSKIQILKEMRQNENVIKQCREQKQIGSFGLANLSHKPVISSLFELIKNKPSIILQFKKNPQTLEKNFHAVHLNKEIFNIIEQNPLEFQTQVTVTSLQSSQINIKTTNYLKLIDFFLQSEIEYLNSGLSNKKQSEKFDLHILSSQNKEIELEMQIFQYDSGQEDIYYVFEGMKLKENCFSSLTSLGLLSRKNSTEIPNNIHSYEPQLRKKKMNNDRKAIQTQQNSFKLQTPNDEYNQKTFLILENEHIMESSTRNSIDSSSLKQLF
ncbi:hypothetical protein TTHERM_00373710 (macronuclear) [Tetrahymena thermophila SB210]|uniref:Uncharacterized protein n=1 Tax=Tetrahymena thermophila (strain SB210) TaxID=312017 RepID=I7M745_TETTS|nr:hypothetical protein TTHERM_00373710 [Tetrahymena thermophila SB210]EAR89355.2 hypothetical protein TTHERM_00373710 [Tetrahymena thermophila SB210]|eukprot:XP_001009600.2 hypothetical protein TTHERM_00373710 [Tetrahymena thermophila SB210]